MNKQVGGLKKITIALAIVVFSTTFISVHTAKAESCTTSSSYGSVQVSLPQLASTGNYNVWVRLQASDSTHNKVLVEVNQNNCLTIGGNDFATPNQWVWVPYTTDNKLAATLHFTSTTGNTAKIIGVQTGVKVDKVMVTQPGCVPTGSGDSCKVQSADTTVANSVASVAPLTNGPVGGKVYPTASISANAASITRIEYSVDGKMVQVVKGAGKFDTTLIANGKHDISIRTFTKGNDSKEETTTIEVDNPETVLTPLKRWARLHSQGLLLAAGIILLLILVVLSFELARARHRKKRFLDFHGF